jgi:KDO2-lipid IV(A) lauroyltransferase
MSVGNPGTAKHLQWRLECLGHTFIECIAGLLPGTWVFRLGEWLGSLLWLLMGKRRRIVIRNLRMAFAGEKSPGEIRALARESFRRSGANLISVAHTARLPVERLHEVIEISNPDLLRETIASGRGVVLLLAHMGNWELLSRIGHLFPKGSRTGAFYRPLNNPLLDQRVLARREADGTRMFSKRDDFHRIAAFLREGGIVGVLADQRVGLQGEVVSFFGRLTRATPLPSLLARRTKSQVLALSLVTSSPGRWRAEFIPVAHPPSTAHCMGALETAMRKDPADVFWLQERWKTYVRANHAISAWIGDDAATGSKRHRMVLWLAGDRTGWVLPPQWNHPDASYEAVLPPEGDIPAGFPPLVRIHRSGPIPAATLLRDIDDADRLPVDMILAPGPDANLAAAAARESIPLLVLP